MYRPAGMTRPAPYLTAASTAACNALDWSFVEFALKPKSLTKMKGGGAAALTAGAATAPAASPGAAVSKMRREMSIFGAILPAGDANAMPARSLQRNGSVRWPEG